MRKKNKDILGMFKLDGYVDIAKKLGRKLIGNTGFQLRLGDDSLFAALYTGNGLTKRYIDVLSDDMTRQWFSVPEDTEGKLMNYLKNLGAKREFKSAIRCSKLFGGSLIFMVIDDGGMPNEKVNINNIKSIKKLKSYSRSKVSILNDNYYKDPTLENFMEPEYFTITNGSEILTVHESRCLVFKGDYYPVDELGITVGYDKYWGISILQSIHEDLENYGLAKEALYKLLIKSGMDVLKIKNLMQLLTNKDGKAQLDARAQTFDLAKSVSTTLLLDSDESFEVVHQVFTGVAETFNKLQESLSGATGIPMTVLFGTGAKGLQADGSGEMRIYYDKIKSDQEDEMLPNSERLIEYISYAKDSGLKFDQEYNVNFNSLWQQTDEEKVKMRNEQAKTDEIYIANGVVDPSEVRQSRFGGDHYSIDTSIDVDIEISNEEAEKENVK